MTGLQKVIIIGKTLFNRLMRRTPAPVFIIGTGRCGSDLMVDILSTNPAIQIDKNEQYDWFLPVLAYGKNHMPIMTDLVNYKLTAKKSLESWTSFFRFKLKIIIENKINSTSKLFILKSPAITFLLDDINKMFPNAKYVHLYRDGRAVAKSWYEKEYHRVKVYRDKFDDNAFLMNCANYYNDSILQINKFLKGIESHRKFELSYESLCENPRLVLGSLLEFLKIEESCNFDLEQIKNTNYKYKTLPPEILKELEEKMNDSLNVLGYLEE